ncbi:MAG: DUF4160 domain-containing protein [FCB group bacterium]|nr:DUF4160 domain-containing protein [FCB group bacterium]
MTTGSRKFWLSPIRLENSGGFSRLELNRIRGTITKHHDELVEAWNEPYGYS